MDKKKLKSDKKEKKSNISSKTRIQKANPVKKSIGFSVRGRTFTGVVTSTKMQKTIAVEWERRVKVPKYERYLLKKSRVKAHLPNDMDVNEGDRVTIRETRPISKTKKFIVVEVLK